MAARFLQIPGVSARIFALSVAIFGFLGATSSSLPEKSPSNAFSDATYGFSMIAPSFAEDKQDRTVIAIFQAPPEDGFSANVTVNVRSLVEMRVSGKDAELLDYDATMAGRRLRFLQLLVVADARVYVVTCTAPLDSFQKYEAQFRKCIESFRLDK